MKLRLLDKQILAPGALLHITTRSDSSKQTQGDKRRHAVDSGIENGYNIRIRSVTNSLWLSNFGYNFGYDKYIM